MVGSTGVEGTGRFVNVMNRHSDQINSTQHNMSLDEGNKNTIRVHTEFHAQ